MPVVVHHRNGQVMELPVAKTCSWKSAATGQATVDNVPRWLECRNERGDVVATYREPEVVGYKVLRGRSIPRFRIPGWRS